MIKKLRSRRGETLVEVMVSLMIVVLIISMLPVALETAARINAQVKSIDTICQHTMDSSKMVSVNAGIYSTGGNLIENLNDQVQGYSENGFTYYVGK